MFFNFIKTAFRNIKKQKIYFIINILGLSIGISASVLIALFVVDELSYDSFHKNADRIVRVTYKLTSSSSKLNVARTAPLYGPTMKNDFPEVEYFNRFQKAVPIIKYGEKIIETENFFYTDKNVFNIFSINLIHGNGSTALEKINSIVISQKTSNKIFGDDNSIGKTIILNDTLSYLVTGIFEDLPTNSHIDINYLAPFPNQNGKWMNTWMRNVFYTYLKINETNNVNDLQNQMPAFVKKYFSQYLDEGETMEVNLTPITDIHLHTNFEQELKPTGSYSNVIIFSIVSFLIL